MPTIRLREIDFELMVFPHYFDPMSKGGGSVLLARKQLEKVRDLFGAHPNIIVWAKMFAGSLSQYSTRTYFIVRENGCDTFTLHGENPDLPLFYLRYETNVTAAVVRLRKLNLLLD